MAQVKKRINIFPFTTSFFENINIFKDYIREILPKLLIVEHTQLRKPDIILFAYQGDHCLWGYAEIESWQQPPPHWAEEGIEWGGAKFRRVYKVKPCSIREFKKHVPYTFLLNLGFDTRTIIYAPQISIETFNQILRKAEGEINRCLT
jgi:hypothetical protein